MLFGMGVFWLRGAAEFKVLPKFEGSKAGFTLLMPEHTDVSFSNALALDRHLTNQIFLNGSGVAAGDVDESWDGLHREQSHRDTHDYHEWNGSGAGCGRTTGGRAARVSIGCVLDRKLQRAGTGSGISGIGVRARRD